MISFVLRVHNEAVTLRASITSLFDIAVPIEIVVVLHRCTEDSKAIALGCQDAAPGRHDVRVVEYDVPVSRAGLETFITPSTSPHSLVSYYNFAFGLASHSWKFKWDGDFIATRAFVDWIDQQVWGKRAPTVIHMSHRLRGSQDASNKEPYLYNCLTGFAQSNFWEVPTFPHDFHRVDAPDRAAFIHASEQAIVKSYWREPPWFAKEKQSTAEQTAEAAELRRLYALAIQLVGPEPIGCARSCNGEAAAYLARFKANQHVGLTGFFDLERPEALAAEESEATPPTVCVAVSCKGQARYLPDAIRSLIAQTFTHWQAVIACGDDESEAQARRLAALDLRIVVLPERADLGLADARNRALRYGKPTPYCMALDADDMLAPTYLQKMMAMVGPTTIAACNLQEFGDRHQTWDWDPQVPIQEFTARIPHGNMIPCASVFPRALWQAVGGYDPMMFCFEDWECWIAMSKVGATLAHCPERLFLYRIHPESMTLRHKSYEEAFRATLLLRYVDPANAHAQHVLANMSPQLAAKTKKQREAFPVNERETALRKLAETAAETAAEPHDQNFFDQMRSCRDQYRRLADCIHAVLGSQNAIDIGCGIGLQTARLKELGWDIVGADHAPAAQQACEPGVDIQDIDLTVTGEAKRFDCVICTETAEHVDAKFADAVVENVSDRATTTILWSAAVPGQEWPGHVNLQPREYWLDKFAARGWRVDTPRTDELRRRMWETQAQHMHCKDNFFVLVRQHPARKLLIYADTVWALGQAHAGLAVALKAHGWDVEFVNWSVFVSGPESDRFDCVLTLPGTGAKALVDKGVAREKIVLVAHCSEDIAAHARSGETFDKYRAYGVVSDSLVEPSITLGVSRLPHVVRMGVDFTRYSSAPRPTSLRTVGYASIMRRMSALAANVEIKRGALAKQCATEAGLSFVARDDLGRVPYGDMPAFYAGVDAVLLSSIVEGSPLPVLEAAAAGRLVIGTPAGHFPRLCVEGLGLLAPIDETRFRQFTVERLRYYRANQQAFTDQCEAGQLAAKRRDWPNVVGDWIELLST